MLICLNFTWEPMKIIIGIHVGLLRFINDDGNCEISLNIRKIVVIAKCWKFAKIVKWYSINKILKICT